jgi:NADH-quinone oxidoreductase subunit L
METVIWLVPAFPLAAFVINGVLGRRFIGRWAGHVASILVGASFVLSVFLMVPSLSGLELQHTLYLWIPVGNFQVSVGLFYDRLTQLMLMVVTTCALLIHIYSVGYMRGDPGYHRFFAYLPLFTFSMLMLVLSSNLLELYVFWEGVGLCSYLLIGFWYEKKSAAEAARKAFIVTRVGDFGFALGIMYAFVLFGSLAYSELFSRAGALEATSLTVLTLLLFAGAVGKSAQFPLHVWLPDAMEGPTPVSALIHAATMVAAGVFMVARLQPLFSLAPTTLLVVAVLGLGTALMAASIGLVNNDIKRIMAYSTISQLGYMFFGLGLGAYVAALFHLATHAFFKALLFLGAGSVMHGTGGETDIRRMGGLGRYMPVTFATTTVGALALAGFPGLSGFWSKDEILAAALVRGQENSFYLVLLILGLLGAFMTAFYAFRMIFLTFTGKPRFDTHYLHVHESPAVMTVPLTLLATLAAVAGLVGIPPEAGWIHGFLAPAFEGAVGEHSHVSALLLAASSGVALAGIGLAWAMYYARWSWAAPELWASRLRPVYLFLLNKWYFDELYAATIVAGTRALARGLWSFDMRAIDGTVNGIAAMAVALSRGARKLQTGLVHNYALALAIGMVLMLALYFLVR